MSTDPAGEDVEALQVVDHTLQLLSVRDQGRRGTCLSFAATAVHEHARLYRRGTACPELSVELLFWRCKQLDGLPGQDGTQFAAVRAALADPGQCEESLWPYDAARSHTSEYTPPTAAIGPDQLRRGTLSPLAATVETASKILREGRTVLAGIELWDSFYECHAAELPAPAGDLDGARHAVCLVGVDERRDAIKLRNSWGTSWGNHGYAWLSRDALALVLIEAWTVKDDIDPD
jgi:C1A family cysteine protease